MRPERFTHQLREAIEAAQGILADLTQNALDTDHLLLSMLTQDGGMVERILKKLKKNTHKIREEAKATVYGGQGGAGAGGVVAVGHPEVTVNHVPVADESEPVRSDCHRGVPPDIARAVDERLSPLEALRAIQARKSAADRPSRSARRGCAPRWVCRKDRTAPRSRL